VEEQNSPQRDVAPALRCEELGDLCKDFSIGASRVVEARRVYYRDGSRSTAGLTAEPDLDCMASSGFYEAFSFPDASNTINRISLN
jgi:hypothetical protein